MRKVIIALLPQWSTRLLGRWFLQGGAKLLAKMAL